jgi:hypothetical protein
MALVTQYKAYELKVHKLNSNNVDISSQLSQANRIRIQHIDGNIEYTITSRTQVGDTWVFNVEMPWNVTGSNTTDTLISIEPALTTNFETSEYNVLLNNIENSRSYNKKQIVDYNSTSEDPINILAIVTNTAQKSQVQEYIYHTEGSIRGKYKGKQLQGVSINEYTEGDKSFGAQPVLEKLSTLIFETEKGQPTGPEILGAGSLSFTNILNIGKDKDSIENYYKNTKAYDTSLIQGISVGDKFTLSQYSTDISIPKILEVTSTDIKVPEKSLYMIPIISGGTVIASWLTNSPTTMSFASSVTVPQVEVLQESPKIYSASLVEDSVSEVFETLQEEFAQGNRVFMSFYKTLTNPLTYTGPDRIENYSFISGSNPDGTLIDPLLYYGVIEINNVTIASGDLRIELSKPRNGSDYSEKISNGENLGTTFGALIWSSSEPSVIIKNTELKGIQKGAFISRDSTPTIEDNLRYIVRNYGGLRDIR